MSPTFPIVTALWLVSLVTVYQIGIKNSKESSKDQTSALQSTPSGSREAHLKNEKPHPKARRINGRPVTRSGVALVKGRRPSHAVTDLIRLSDPIERSYGFLALVDQIQEDEFEEVLDAFIAEGLTRSRMSEFSILLHAWGKAAPEEAIRYAQSTGQQKNEASQIVLASWVQNDPESAISWAQDNHETSQANPYLVGVIQGLSSLDPERSHELLLTMPYSRERGQALQSVMQGMSLTNPDRAKELTLEFEEQSLRNAAVRMLTNTLAPGDPAGTAEWILSLDEKEAKNQGIRSVSAAWAQKDFEQAKKWVEKLSSDQINHGAQGLISDFVDSDIENASQWLSSLQENHPVDGAIRSFAVRGIYQDPELSMGWVSEIANDGYRNSTYHRALGRWANVDKESASAWFFQNQETLPKGVQRRFNKRFGSDH